MLRENLFKKILMLSTVYLLVPSFILGNGLNLNGVGSKAIGMGGAFVGLSDDYSAVFWNPAGLTQLEGTSVSLFITDVIPTGTFENEAMQIDATTVSNHYLSGAVGAFFDIGSKLKIGFFGDVPSGLGAEWDGGDLLAYSGGPGGDEFEWMSKLGVFHFGPAVAYRFSDKFSVGATVNIAYGMMDMFRPVDADGDQFGLMDTQYEEESTGMGVGFTFGALIKPSDILSIGLSMRTESTVAFSGTAENPSFANAGAPTESDFDRDITWPMWIAGGIAFKPSDKLTFTADAQFTQWEETVDELVTEYDDPVWSTQLGAVDGDKLNMQWENRMQIRVGAQYMLSESFAVRAGYYNDPTPGPDETANIILPQIDYNAFTFGFGWNTSAFAIDFAIEILRGSERDIEQDFETMNMGGLHNMNMIVPNIAFTYHFSK